MSLSFSEIFVTTLWNCQYKEDGFCSSSLRNLVNGKFGQHRAMPVTTKNRIEQG